MARQDNYVSLLGEPDVMPRRYDGLLGWSAEWRCMIAPEEKPVPLDDITSLDASPEEIIVKRGDSLSQIAHKHGCTVKELAELNHIRNVSLIWPGQTIKLPVREYKYHPSINASIAQPADRSCTLSFTFEDLIEKPIHKLKVKIVSAAGSVYETVTDEMGKIRDYVMEQAGEITVFVSAGGNGVKEAARFTPSEGKSEVTLTSPKVRIRGVTQPIKDRAGSIDTELHPVNTVVTGRDSKGNPVVQINHTCPNEYDLQLGKNLIYWDHIIQAAKKSGITPQSIAAVINAESMQEKGVWKKDSVAINVRKTKEERALKKKAGLPADDKIFYLSSAAGMTQFLNGTWISETFREGTYLNQTARKRGILADRVKRDALMNPVLDPRTHKPITEVMFEISPEIWKTEKQIRANGYLDGGTPYPHQATRALQSWLNLRFDAEFAIMAAVDYGLHPLNDLIR